MGLFASLAAVGKAALPAIKSALPAIGSAIGLSRSSQAPGPLLLPPPLLLLAALLFSDSAASARIRTFAISSVSTSLSGFLAGGSMAVTLMPDSVRWALKG